AGGEVYRGEQLAQMAAEDVLLEVQRGGELTLRDPKGRVRLYMSPTQRKTVVKFLGEYRRLARALAHDPDAWLPDPTKSGGSLARPKEMLSSLDRLIGKVQSGEWTFSSAYMIELMAEAIRAHAGDRRVKGKGIYNKGDIEAALKAVREVADVGRRGRLQALNAMVARALAEPSPPVNPRLATAPAVDAAKTYTREELLGRMAGKERGTAGALAGAVMEGRWRMDEASWVAWNERGILDDVKRWRAELRDMVFRYTIEYTDAFSTRVSKAAQHAREAPQLHGGLLEVLQLDVAQAEADMLNKLKAAGSAAYGVLLAEIFNGQDTSVLNDKSIQYKWIAKTSPSNRKMEDVRLAAVELAFNPKTGEMIERDISILSKIYECKSFAPVDMEDPRSKSRMKYNARHMASEIVARAIQDYVFHGLEASVAEIQLVISCFNTDQWGGMRLPMPMGEALRAIEALDCFKEHGTIPAMHLFQEEGRNVYARIALRDDSGNVVNPFTMTAVKSANGHQCVRIEFDCEISKDGGKTWAHEHVTEIVSWDPTPNRDAFGGNRFIRWMLR
ncbi:MAG: hypothetical protein Q6365_019115, partial [Candidatus Sigynarchaeota archaeon]